MMRALGGSRIIEHDDFVESRMVSSEIVSINCHHIPVNEFLHRQLNQFTFPSASLSRDD
jgi:hypothetical protein